MRRGATGSNVTALQELLNANGADLVVDGEFGPLTEAAVKAYQEQQGLTVDGIAGPNTMGKLQGETVTEPTPDTTTGEPGGGTDLIISGNSQLWFNSDTGEHWVVYLVPAVSLADGTTSGDIYYGWRIETDEELDALVGPGNSAVPAFSGTNGDFGSKGLVDLGMVGELLKFDLEDDPFDTWVEDFGIIAADQPWLLDADYQKLAVQAVMERADGRMSVPELHSTQWWINHNPAERSWMETYHSDPAAAQQMLDDNREDMRVKLSKAGIDNASDSLIRFMADKVTMGGWSANHLAGQIAALADPASVDVIDDELFTFLANDGTDLDGTRRLEDRVRTLLQTWLGPTFGDWSGSAIAEQAGILRNNPDGELEFVEFLKDQRMAMFPNYDNRNLSYQAIMQPWKNVTQSTWGVPVEETDETFMKIVQMNDPEAANKLMRGTGFDRGYDKVVNEVSSGIRSGMRNNIRGAV